MPKLRLLVASLLAAAFLALPVAAVAQSAGDDQYTDPFAGSGKSKKGGGGNGSNGSSGTQSQTGGSGSSGSTSGVAGTSAAGSSSASAGSGQLPNTGVNPGLFFAVGATLTAGGFALRRIA